MKKILTYYFFSLLMIPLFSQTDLSYYLPEGDYDEEIPAPSSVTGHEIGEWHLTHDRLTSYLTQLAKTSDRVVLQEYARSYENRPLFHLIITSPGNHARLEQIRTDHLKLSDPAQSGEVDAEGMPVVIRLGYNVHGNESSAGNASVLVAYYLAASASETVSEYLDNMVILLDPCLNPDGFNRHASWVNMHKSIRPMGDPNSRGFRETWPGGRTNHYWFDLNRDWILVQQPESRGRVDVYHNWKPNVQTDHHEMGSASSFFFQPGVPGRTNPFTPEAATELTQKIGRYHREALDEIGSLYFTEERFDDFYYGKGSSYPDVNGGIGILFEQAAARGYERNTPGGKLTFPFAIRNQVTVSLSSLKASFEMRVELLEHLKSFYRETGSLYNSSPEKAYILGDDYDLSRMAHLLDILLKHRIEVYSLKKPYTAAGTTYQPGKAYLVPLDQKQYRLVQSLFRTSRTFEDSIFYDISAWTLPHAFNIPYAAIGNPKLIPDLKGPQLTEVPSNESRLIGPDKAVGYLFRWDDYYAAKALYSLQSAGLKTHVAVVPVHYVHDGLDEHFSYGSIFVPLDKQKMDAGEIRELMLEVAEETGLDIYAMGTSYTVEGIDLGSTRFAALEKPEILLLTGEGVRSLEAGEIWHLLDTRFNVPAVLIDQLQLNSLDLSDYTHLIMPSGTYTGISQQGVEEIERFVKKGGTIIALNSANEWLQKNKLADITFLDVKKDSTRILPYIDLRENVGASRIPGSIFEAELDISHPVAYGLHRNRIPVFRNSTLIANPIPGPYAQPLRYTSDPLLSGYVPRAIKEHLGDSPGIVIGSRGEGKVISFVDNPNFRAFWYGTNRLFLNAIFFGPVISGSSTGIY